MAAPGDGQRDLLRRVSAISNIATTLDSPQGTLMASEPGTPNEEPQPSTVEHDPQPQHGLLPLQESIVVPESWLQKSLLSFDGGGIRGYASLLMLRALMIHIGRIELTYNQAHTSSYQPCERPASSNQKRRVTDLDEGCLIEYLPCHYFDYIAGTSTGGLIATMLSRWRMSVKECIAQYEVVGNQIFGAKWRLSVLGFPQTKHSKKPLKAAIKTLVQEKTATTPGQPPNLDYQKFPAPPDLCRTIVFAIRKGKTTRNPNESIKKSRPADSIYLFRSYRPVPFDECNPPRNYGVDINLKIWKVCRATTAAPNYFDSQRIGDDEFCDGGAGVNNPTFEALEEMSSLHGSNVKIAASFGTGQWEPPSMFREGSSSGLSRLHIVPALARVNRLLKNAKGALTDCQKTHEYVKRSERLLNGTPKAFQYYRFNVEDDLGKVKMDECKDRRDNGNGGKCSTLEYIRICTDNELGKDEVNAQLQALATILVAKRRRRIKDDPDMWARFATCVRYKCTEDDCRADGKFLYFNLRRELQQHLLTEHNTPPELVEFELDQRRQWPEFPTGPF